MNDLPEFPLRPELKNPSLIIGWVSDISHLGTKITDYLVRKLGGKSFYDIEPLDFFPLGGVTIEGNIVQFPESKFYAVPAHDLLILKSTPPSYEWHRFLNLILDVAEEYRVKEILTLGGMISLSAHTAPRQVMGTFNQLEFRNALSGYGLSREWDYESPPGQRPTLNSFLLWAANRRNFPGGTLWGLVPFYMAGVEDPGSAKRVLELFNQRYNLNMDFSDLDKEIEQQNQLIADLRRIQPGIDSSIQRLESNLRLSDEENQELIKEIEKSLSEKRG